MSPIAALSATAPLMFTPESRVSHSGIGEWFRGAGGLRLRLAFWEVPKDARGTVFISPGRGEPIEKYYETISDLLARDFCVVAHDWRGQGLSARLLPDRLKCHARSSDECLDDFQRLLDIFEDRAPKPWLMLGHSMGAALNLATLDKGETRIAGACFINPMLRVKTGKHSLWSVNFQTNWQVNHGRGTEYVPQLFDDPFTHRFETDALTHDAVRYDIWHEQLFACPHLAVGSPTWGWLQFALKLGEGLLKDKARSLKKIKIPVIIICSGDDHVINKLPTRAFAKKLGEGRYVEIANAEHELLIEQDIYRNEVLAEFDAMADVAAPRGGVPVTSVMPDAMADDIALANFSDMAADIGEVASELPQDISPESLIPEDALQGLQPPNGNS